MRANMHRLIEFSRGIWKCMVAAQHHFNKSDGWAMSSHVALSLMISVFPFLIFATSLAGFVGNPTKSSDLVDLTFEFWPDEIAAPVTRELNIVLAEGNAGLLTLGIALALFFASNGIEAVRVALNRAYQDNDARPAWKQRLQSIIFVIAGAFLLLALSALIIFVPKYLSFVEHASPAVYGRFFAGKSLTFTTALGLLVFVIFACHYWLPGHRRSVSETWPGIALTLLLWTLSANVFTSYLKLYADYNATYAGLAGIMTAQIFLYVMAVVLIFGAEFNAALEGIRRPDPAQSA